MKYYLINNIWNYLMNDSCCKKNNNKGPQPLLLLLVPAPPILQLLPVCILSVLSILGLVLAIKKFNSTSQSRIVILRPSKLVRKFVYSARSIIAIQSPTHHAKWDILESALWSRVLEWVIFGRWLRQRRRACGSLLKRKLGCALRRDSHTYHFREKTKVKNTIYSLRGRLVLPKNYLLICWV